MVMYPSSVYKIQNHGPWIVLVKKQWQKIKTESASWTIFCDCQFRLGIKKLQLYLFCLFPHDEDMFFCRYTSLINILLSTSLFLNWIYRSMFFIIVFTMVNCSHLFLYGIQQILFQLYLLLTHIGNLTNSI
jgi:hypothetical protein